MNVGCCNEVQVTGLTTDAANREGTYVKQEGTYYDRDVYKKVDSEMYIHWDGYRWTVCIFSDHLIFLKNMRLKRYNMLHMYSTPLNLIL